MKKILFPLFLAILLLTLQTTWLAFPPVRRVRPDIIMILTLYLGLRSTPVSGGILAFFLGYSMDLFSGNGFGLYAFSRTFLFYGAQYFRGRFYLEHFQSQALFVFLFTLAEGFLLMLLLKVLNPEHYGNLYPLFFNVFLPQSLSTALVSPFCFSLLGWGSALLFTYPQAGLGKKG